MREMYQISTCSPQEVTPQQVDEIDLMLVAIPLGYRASYLKLCRTRSKPLVLEKPISVEQEALKLLKDNFHARQLGVVLQRRYYQSSYVMREIISDQRYGKLTCLEVVAGSYDLKSGGAGRYLTDAKISGGGILAEFGIHGLDIALHAVQASGFSELRISSIQENGIDYEAVGNCAVNAPGGCFELKFRFSRFENLHNGYFLTFEQGQVFIPDQPNGKLWFMPNEGETRRLVEPKNWRGAESSRGAFWQMWRDMFECLDEGEPLPTSIHTQGLAHQLVNEAYQQICNESGVS